MNLLIFKLNFFDPNSVLQVDLLSLSSRFPIFSSSFASAFASSLFFPHLHYWLLRAAGVPSGEDDDIIVNEPQGYLYHRMGRTLIRSQLDAQFSEYYFLLLPFEFFPPPLSFFTSASHNSSPPSNSSHSTRALALPQSTFAKHTFVFYFASCSPFYVLFSSPFFSLFFIFFVSFTAPLFASLSSLFLLFTSFFLSFQSPMQPSVHLSPDGRQKRTQEKG